MSAGTARVTGAECPAGEPDHVISLTFHQVREAIRLYVDAHKLVPVGVYTVASSFMLPSDGELTVKQEFWRNPEVTR